MSIDLKALFIKPCGYCISGKATYYYCTKCGGSTGGAATCRCAEPQSQPREEPCRVCGGSGEFLTGLGLFPVLQEEYATDIRQYQSRGITADQARSEAMNGSLAHWYSVETDGWEKILQRLLEGHIVILEITGKLIPMSLRPWNGCFD